MDEDRLELVVGGGYNGDVVCIDDDPRSWTSVGMFNVLYDRPHYTRPDAVAGCGAFRVACYLFYFNLRLVNKAEIDLHNKGVVYVTYFVHEFVARELGSEVVECPYTIAATECARDVEVGDDAASELVENTTSKRCCRSATTSARLKSGRRTCSAR
eukprot:Mrub_11632.p2 GENE.Mrub_11632~~Mrub_11632.p2  ORF type:complete len:173 (-),score=8.74 Mrub_11632:86-553(-)